MAVADSLADWIARVDTLRALTQRLQRLAQRNCDTELAEITGALYVLGAEMALSLQHESSTFTLSTKDYARRLGIPLRTVQGQCKTGKIPAIMTPKGWLIRDETSTDGIQCQ